MLEEVDCTNFYMCTFISAQIPKVILILFPHFSLQLYGYIIY